jgi:ankyrin repeat protein
MNFLILSLFGALFTYSLQAEEYFIDTTSTMQSSVIDLITSSITANGILAASEEIKLQCTEIFAGTGTLRSPHITIVAKKFEFTGTLCCNNSCHITVQEDFDETIFQRNGTGKFTITIDPSIQVNDTHSVSSSYRKTLLQDSSTISTSFFTAPRTFNIEGNTFTFSGKLPLTLADAIEKGNFATVKSILQDDQIKNDTRQLSLYMLMAGLLGHISIAEAFISAGADVNGKDTSFGPGQAHIVTAVIHKKSEFVALLVRSGANLNVEKSKTPVLMIAVMQNDLPTVRVLSQAPHINLDATNLQKQTSLMYAAHEGNLEMVKALLDAGARTDIKDLHWNTALNYAQARNKNDIVRLLQSHDRK